MNETEAREAARRVQHMMAVALAEHALGMLADVAMELTAEDMRRVLDAVQRVGDARRALISPLARAMPASESRN